MTDKTQEIMDKAYERWQAHKEWSKKEFRKQLNNRELVVVLIGNMNYQVQNGGWIQWNDNGYSEGSAALHKILMALGENGQMAAVLMSEALRLCKKAERAQNHQNWSWEHIDYVYTGIMKELEPLDKKYYMIDDALMQELEFIVSVPDEEFDGWWRSSGLPIRHSVVAVDFATQEARIAASFAPVLGVDWAPGVL